MADLLLFGGLADARHTRPRCFRLFFVLGLGSFSPHFRGKKLKLERSLKNFFALQTPIGTYVNLYSLERSFPHD